MLVSVILPTYNGSKSIRTAIKSVLSQNYHSLELLVIDDGSGDDTASVVQEFIDKDNRVRYFKNNKNSGIQRSLNRGLREATGELVARIDDDDEWVDSQKLTSQVEFFKNNPEYILVGTGLIVQDTKGRELYRFLNPVEDKEIRQRLLYRNCFSHSTVMFRRAEVLKSGGYDEGPETLHVEDYDLWLRIGRLGKFANLASFSVQLTVHKRSISGTQKLVQLKKQMEVTKKYLCDYPNAWGSRVSSWLRLWLYLGFGKLVPRWLEYKVVAVYKKN